MEEPRTAEVIENKRKPPLWSVKAGNRYVASFMGLDAKARAVKYATKNFGIFTLVEKPTPKREQLRLDAMAERASLSKKTKTPA
jgi:hypothetical protein